MHHTLYDKTVELTLLNKLLVWRAVGVLRVFSVQTYRCETIRGTVNRIGSKSGSNF